MIRRGGVHNGQRLLGTRAVGLMTTNQIGDIRPTNGLGYGYGFETTDRYGANELEPVGDGNLADRATRLRQMGGNPDRFEHPHRA